MVVTLHGFPLSTCTQAVLVTLKELGVPYELVNVDLKAGDQKRPEYIENMQPFGQIPVLVDEDGFKVYESRAISRYLIAKYSPEGGLIPKDLKKNALFEQAMSVENNDFYPYSSRLVIEKVFKPMMHGAQPSEELATEYAATLEKNVKVYETILGKQKYLAGNEITLADLLHIPFGIHLESAGFKGLTTNPNVARWWSDISSRNSWKEVQKIAEEVLAKMKK